MSTRVAAGRPGLMKGTGCPLDRHVVFLAELHLDDVMHPHDARDRSATGQPFAGDHLSMERALCAWTLDELCGARTL